MNGSVSRPLVASVVIGAVAAAVVWGLVQAGTPGQERRRRLDERRIDDLRGVARAVDLHWTRHGELPMTLDEVSNMTEGDVTIRDPGTGDTYEFRVLSDTTFELCASFETDWLRPSVERFWLHSVGRACFDSEVRPVQRQEADDHVGRVSPPLHPGR